MHDPLSFARRCDTKRIGDYRLSGVSGRFCQASPGGKGALCQGFRTVSRLIPLVDQARLCGGSVVVQGLRCGAVADQ
jgi:hypothetical protein